MSLLLKSNRLLTTLGKNLVQTKKFSIATRLLTTKFTKDHEWIKVDGKIGTVGITDYAQDKLGEVVYLELPEIGANLKQKGKTQLEKKKQAPPHS